MKEKKEKIDKIDKEEKIKEKGSFKERFSLRLRKRLLTNRMHTFILIVFLVLVFIGINVWAQSKDLAQIDVTANQLYSLTDASKEQLKDLNKEVNIYIYGYKEDTAFVTFIKQYSAFNNNIKSEIVSAETNYEIINKYSLSDSGYNSIVVACGDKDKILYPDYEFTTQDYVDGVYSDVDLTEESITNAILNVSTDDPIKMYFTSGEGEYTTSQVTGLVSLLESQVYECEELNLLSTTEIPADCDVLVILDPTSDITVDAANAIKTYISNGGNIFCAMKKINAGTEYTNLQQVLDLYGVSVEYGALYEGNSNNCLSYNGTSYPHVLIPKASSASKISENLSNSGYTTVLPWAQRLVINSVEEENVDVSNVELLYTSEKCYALTDIETGLKTDGVEPGAYTIAGKFTRKMTTPAGENTEESSKTSNLIMVGNAGFLADYAQISQIQLRPITYQGNASFALNCFADLADQENLITVKKTTNVPTFVTTTMQDLIVKTIIFGLPVLIIIIGVVIWNIRRRKR